MDAAAPLFRMEGVSKRYGGVRALEDAELTVHGGRVHAILGENGAGKSTLIKVMAGVVAPDKGRMTLEGNDVSFPEHVGVRVADSDPDAGQPHAFEIVDVVADVNNL